MPPQLNTHIQLEDIVTSVILLGQHSMSLTEGEQVCERI
jgi:hypothetical protein